MTATREQLVQQALDHMAQATWPPEKWARTIETGYRGHRYDYAHTANFLAQQALWDAVHAPTGATAGPPWYGRRVAFLTAVTDTVIDHLCALASLGVVAAFSADRNEAWAPGGAYYATDAQIHACKTAGVKTMSWADGSATPLSYAARLRSERGLDGACGQFETLAEYDALIAAGFAVGVGNPAELTSDQARLKDAIARSSDGRTAFIGEVMQPDPGYSAQGVAITSACFYVDRDAAQGGPLPLSAYAGMPVGLRQTCSLYGPHKLDAAGWEMWREWLSA